ncbi:MAG: hypothetical protein JXB48_10865 [Candidatus Latescibacteria bacterium]|nr:hypothetical protein [Candidatus Latescibacterota bacterium]
MSEKKMSRRGFMNTSLGLSAGFAGISGCSQSEETTVEKDNQQVGEGYPEKLLRNAKIVLEASCRAKQGETLLIIADDILLPYAPAIAEAALSIGVIPSIVDIRHLVKSEQYKDGYVLQSLKEAMDTSDIVIENLADTWVPNRPGYGRLYGNPDMHDKSLSGERRWMILQCNGLGEWDVTPEEIAVIPERTRWLKTLLSRSKKGHISSAGGTDFTFGLGGRAGLVPVLGIIPFYGEVAVMPVMENTEGILVFDGPTQREVRPADELDREPLRITVEKGRAVDLKGDAIQLKRLKEFIASGNPPADAIDEVGILTTSLVENDLYYWSDGTHHHDRTHVALGNNVRRDVVVHGPKHMDGEVNKPTIKIDDLLIMKDGVFQDNSMML